MQGFLPPFTGPHQFGQDRGEVQATRVLGDSSLAARAERPRGAAAVSALKTCSCTSQLPWIKTEVPRRSSVKPAMWTDWGVGLCAHAGSDITTWCPAKGTLFLQKMPPPEELLPQTEGTRSPRSIHEKPQPAQETSLQTTYTPCSAGCWLKQFDFPGNACRHLIRPCIVRNSHGLSRGHAA